MIIFIYVSGVLPETPNGKEQNQDLRMSSPWVYPFGGTTPALHYPAEPPPRLDPGDMGATSRGTGPMNIIPISPMLIFIVPSSHLTQFG